MNKNCFNFFFGLFLKRKFEKNKFILVIFTLLPCFGDSLDRDLDITGHDINLLHQNLHVRIFRVNVKMNIKKVPLKHKKINSQQKSIITI